MKNLAITFIAVLTFVGTNLVSAQQTEKSNHNVTINVPRVALLDVVGGDITLAPAAPTEAGAALDFDVDGTKSSVTYLNYSSILYKTTARTISVELDKLVPAGLKLLVQAGAASADGRGAKGAVSGAQVLLDNTAKTIVTGVGSCYTGIGNKGHQMSYELALADETDANYTSLNELNNTTVKVTYTIVD